MKLIENKEWTDDTYVGVEDQVPLEVIDQMESLGMFDDMLDDKPTVSTSPEYIYNVLSHFSEQQFNELAECLWLEGVEKTKELLLLLTKLDHKSAEPVHNYPGGALGLITAWSNYLHSNRQE